MPTDTILVSVYGGRDGFPSQDVPPSFPPFFPARRPPCPQEEPPAWPNERRHSCVSCFRPVEVWPACPPATGIVWARNQSYPGAVAFPIPCGQCIGCRLDKARDWALRIGHEASLHSDNCFITLTYADQFLPGDGSVSVRATQLFFKRLRKASGSVRYFVCGEYGEGELGRPHYHAIVFGFAFPDRTVWRVTPRGDTVWRSALLERVWPYGLSEVGSVTHESAGYVARYCLKKVTGRAAKEAYRKPHPVTGQVFDVVAPFAHMSRRPGVGAGWWDLYASDCFPSDFLVQDGKRVPVPRFYRKKLEGMASLRVLQDRKASAREHADNNTEPRLAVREEVTRLRVKTLTRNLE